jgi:Flp pilus assembly protein TadG
MRLPSSRPAKAAVELAILVPILSIVSVITLDWSRVFYASVIVDNCARNGALYASDPYTSVQSPYGSLKDAALADAPNLTPQPTVTSATGTDAGGRTYVDCTVSYTFQTLTDFPGVPSKTVITRTVRVYQAPQAPN